MDVPAWHELFTATLREQDPAIARLIEEQGRQNAATVNLVASETYCPRASLEAEASLFVNKNASGYPPRSDFGGGAIMDHVERLACERACRLFNAEHANIQALSSTIANVAVLRGLLTPGDRILAFDPAAGGHGSHGSGRHLSGRDYTVRTFGVDEASGRIDLDGARKAAREWRPKLIIAGSSAYPWAIDFKELAEIARECEALAFADIAHVAGLVAAGLHENPTPYYDVVTTSTHKTLCGPRTGGLILSRRRHAQAIDAALMPGLQAAPGAHIIAARAALFEMVGGSAFKALMRAVLENAATLAHALAAEGVKLYCGGTDTHMLVVDLGGTGWSAPILNERLLHHGIVANTMRLPDPSGRRIGLRLGSTPMTVRGATPTEFGEIGSALARFIQGGPEAPDDIGLKRAAEAIAHRRPVPFV